MTRTPRDPASAARRIIDTLREHGHVALLAGGCVRDMVLGTAPKDYDVATNAPPERLAELFPAARQVGAKFGVVLVRLYGHDVEVATFRSDGAYSDGRRPDEVIFGGQREDAQRRDFTINGMFFDPVENQVIDYVGGREDLAARVVRTIGHPDERFAEDHLRLLRAVRFAARLGFAIDPPTMEAIRRHAHRLPTISAERIWMELALILAAPTRATGWRLLREAGLRPFLAPAWPASEEGDETGGRRLEWLDAAPLPVRLPMAALLAGLPAAVVGRIGRDLRWSNQMRVDTVWLVASLPRLYGVAQMEPADLKLLMASSIWLDLLALLRADELARTGRQAAWEAALEQSSAIAPEDVAPPPLLTGEDLKAMGVVPGRTLGRVLDAVYRAQLNGQLDSAQAAKEMAIRLLGSGLSSA